MDTPVVNAIYAALIAFFINVVLCPIFIPYLTRLKFGQIIRDDGPQSHLKKANTPTMGGVVILFSLVIASMFFIRGNREGLLVLFATIGFGLIGFIDDYIKIVKRRSLGLRAYQKIVLQLLVATVFIWMASSWTTSYFYPGNPASMDTYFIVPFTHGKVVDLGLLYFPVLFIVMIGTVNSVNLTDGLDGLAAGVSLLVVTFFAFVALSAGSPVLPVAGAAAGSLLGFLLFNAYPARVFMGDTGSLALGGFIAAIAVILKAPLFLCIVGLIYVLESVSVIIQVLYFKKTGKRFFKMAPIHHSFELSGWPETRVVTLFYVITAVLCLGGFLGMRYF